MRRSLILGVAAVALLAQAARADLGPRRPPGQQPQFPQFPQNFQGQPTKLVIEVDEKAKDIRLVIPIESLNGGIGGGIGVPGGGFGIGGGFQGVPPGGGAGLLGTPPPGGGQLGTPPGGFPPFNPPTKPNPGKQSALPMQTIMIGLALALTMAIGGLWLVRRKPGVPGNGLTAMLLAVVLLGGGATAVVLANRAPPFRPPTPPPAEQKNLPQLASMDNVHVELSVQRGPVRLIIPASMKDKFTKAAEEKK